MRTALDRLSGTIPTSEIAPRRAVAVAAGAVALATAARLAIDPYLPGVPFVTFFPAILVAAIWGGSIGGAVGFGLSLVVVAYVWLGVADGAWVFRGAFMLVAFAAFAGLLLLVAGVVRRLVLERARSEERTALLARELRHRINNLIAMSIALARQTARGTQGTEDFLTAFETRMIALGQAQDLLSERPGKAADLLALLERILAPFGCDHFRLSGPGASVPDTLVPMLGLGLHELATNAVKHGALSRPEGVVEIVWRRDSGRIAIEWRESGGPAVVEPGRHGFGSLLLRGLGRQGAETALEFRPGGLLCRISFDEAPAPAGRAAGKAAEGVEGVARA